MLDRVVDVINLCNYGILVVRTVDLGSRVDYATAVDNEIGSVVNTASLKCKTGCIVKNLVVRAAGNSLTVKHGDGGRIDDRAHCIGREDIALLAVDFLSGNYGSSEFLGRTKSDLLVGTVCNNKLRATVVKKAAKVVSNLTKSLYCNGKTFKRVSAKSYLCGCSDTLPYAASGEGGGISTVLGKSADVVGLTEHNESVIAGGVHVLGSDITTTKTVYSLAKRLKHSLGLLRGICDNYALASTVRKTCNCVLVRHTARKAENVKECIVVGSIGEETATADCRAEIGVVYGDDRLQARLLIVDKQYLFMTVFGHFSHCVHIYSPLKVSKSWRYSFFRE